MNLIKTNSDAALWTVELRCAFFKGKIQSAKVQRSCGNKTIDAQAVQETLGRHVPEVSFGTRRHEYWRNITWTMPKNAPASASLFPASWTTASPHLLGHALPAVCSVTCPVWTGV